MILGDDWARMSLDAIGLYYGTDKASSHHGYLSHYDALLRHLRDQKLKILEIGVYDGQSLSVWERYFPNAEVIGCDIMPHSQQYESDRITIEIIDQSNIEDLTRVAIKHGPFDLIIEDGSHMHEHQLTSLRTLFPHLKPGGTYIVEDLQTNFGNMAPFYKGVSSATCVDYLIRWLNIKVADDQIDLSTVEDAFLRTYGRAVEFLSFYRRACVIQKGLSATSDIEGAQTPMSTPFRDEVEERATILAHVSVRGDILGDRGFVNPVADGRSYEIQGVSISTPGDLLEYRVRSALDTWSDWASEGTFLGTRGQFLFLTGISVRKKSAGGENISVKVIGKFLDGEYIEVDEGRECVSQASLALCGLRIAILRGEHAGVLRSPAGAT